MSEFICNDCGHIFYGAEATLVKESHDEIDGDFAEYFMICPCCGSDNFEEAAYCDKCGCSILYEKLKGGYYCPDCMGDWLASSYVIQFAQDEIDAFAEFVHEKESCECSSVKGT